MGKVGGGVGAGAGGFFHEVLWEVGGAVLVDVVLHPGEEGKKVGFAEGRGNFGILHGCFEELGRVDVAERVGGEVSEATHRPVDVLEASVGVVGRAEAEEFFELFIPGGGDVGHFEVSGKEGAFELEAEEDVKVVSGFVGFNADGRVGRAVDGREELIEVELLKVGKEFLGAREPLFPKGTGAADVVFPEAGL